MVKLIQRHELVSEYNPSKITDEDYDAFISQVNSVITENKDKGSVKIVITGMNTADFSNIDSSSIFPFPDDVFQSVYKRFKKDLKKSEYNVSSYGSTIHTYYYMFEIDWIER